MSSKAITPERQDEHQPAPPPWQPRETAPSVVREDEPGLPRSVGMVGGALVIFGGMILARNLWIGEFWVGVGFSSLLLALGLGGLLFHAAFDRDLQIRRMYLVFAASALVLGGVLLWLPQQKIYGFWFRYGFLFEVVALLFCLAALRNETDSLVRQPAQLALGGAGAVMVLVGLVGGSISADFLLPYGLLLALLGLAYLSAFVGSRGVSDDLAYRAGVGVGAAGLAVVAVALTRTFLSPGLGYFIPAGFILLLLGAAYLLFSFGLSSDRPLAVLTRRELGAFFYSPMAYLVLFGFTIVSYVGYFRFLSVLADPRFVQFEPIIEGYFWDLFPVLTVVFMVPVLTMRLLSEEQRSGTLEVLLTAPVTESGVVLSKFLAAYLTYLVIWLPFGLYLAAIPLGGGNPFDYRPLLSFSVVIAVTGAGFISMGLFFSSLTRNQVASGVLTFAGMLVLTGFAVGAWYSPRDSNWRVVFAHLSYLQAWQESLRGELVPRDLLFPLSLAVLFLFLTVKVLESRKWR
jgi:hypothetical protein